MSKIYFISPIGRSNPTLFPSFRKIFSDNGITEVNSVLNADVVFFDIYSGLNVDYNWYELNWALDKEIPLVVYDETDFGGMSEESWFGFKPNEYINQTNGKAFVSEAMKRQLKIVYFMRKMDKTISYPSWVYPIELCYYNDCDFPPATKDELFNRPYDICFIGNTSPQRESVIKGLRESGKFKVYVHWTNEKGKMPHEEWIRLHGRAKLFLTADGGGFTDERIQQLFSVSGILKQKNNQLQDKPLTSPFECLEVNERPTEDDIHNVEYLINYEEQLYTMYRSGVDHIKLFYSEQYRANYILGILKQENIL